MNDSKLDLILESNQLILRDRQFNDGVFEEKAQVIDKQITDILNPKQETPLRELTKDALHEEVAE